MYVFSLADTTKEHFSFTIALGMRTFVVVTKIDMCQEHTTKKVVEQVEKLLTSYKKIPVVVKDDEQVLVTAQKFLNDKYVYIILFSLCIFVVIIIFSIVPIFMVSSLTGHNLEQLQSFLNDIPLTQMTTEQEDKTHQQLPEFQVHTCVHLSTHIHTHTHTHTHKNIISK